MGMFNGIHGLGRKNFSSFLASATQTMAKAATKMIANVLFIFLKMKTKFMQKKSNFKGNCSAGATCGDSLK